MQHELQMLYDRFLNIFPAVLHPFVSFALGIFILYAIFQVIKQNFIYLIALVVLLPASVPILKSVWQAVFAFIKFVFGMK